MSENPADRPHVIVHMTSSVDGRIVEKRWSAIDGDVGYESVHAELKGDAWMCGRITMRGYTRGTPGDDTDSTPVPRTDHIAKSGAKSWAIALDFSGRLHWGWRNDIEGDHVVVVVGETVPDQHLNALRASGVSYVFGGKDRLDLALVLKKLKQHFGIGRLLVEGGGGINGAFLQAGLVDEISLLLAPAVDGGRGIPAVFDYDVAEHAEPAGKGMKLALKECNVRENGVVRLRYGVTRQP
jgi:riboflavin biosynthesis pyrimidine reductase